MLHAADAAAAKFSQAARLCNADRDDAFQNARLAVLEVAARGHAGTFSYWYTIARNALGMGARAERRRPSIEARGAVKLYGYKPVMEAVQ